MRRLRINRADVARLKAAIRASRFETVDPRPEVIAAISVLRLYFDTWIEAPIGNAMLHIVGVRRQKWTRSDPATGTQRLRVSQSDVRFLRDALASARFERADDREEFVAAATLMREFIATEIIAPLVTTLEHITGRMPR